MNDQTDAISTFETTVTTTAKDIIHYTETCSGHIINHDEGIQVGVMDTPINQVTVCWMTTADAISAAGENGSDLLIAHESLYYPYNVLPMETSHACLSTRLCPK